MHCVCVCVCGCGGWGGVRVLTHGGRPGVGNRVGPGRGSGQVRLFSTGALLEALMTCRERTTQTHTHTHLIRAIGTAITIFIELVIVALCASG